MQRKTGTYQTIASTTDFIPYPLPPKNPELELNAEIMDLYISYGCGMINKIVISPLLGP
jgi:hypothetical protein